MTCRATYRRNQHARTRAPMPPPMRAQRRALIPASGDGGLPQRSCAHARAAVAAESFRHQRPRQVRHLRRVALHGGPPRARALARIRRLASPVARVGARMRTCSAPLLPTCALPGCRYRGATAPEIPVSGIRSPFFPRAALARGLLSL